LLASWGLRSFFLLLVKCSLVLNLFAIILSVSGLLFCITDKHNSKSMQICQVIVNFTQGINRILFKHCLVEK
jgi:hypothetical protein